MRRVGSSHSAKLARQAETAVFWMPACAGMTSPVVSAGFSQIRHSRESGNPVCFPSTFQLGNLYNGSPRATGGLGPGNRYGPCDRLLSRGGRLITCILASREGRWSGLSAVR